MNSYLVGGAVRDRLLGLDPKERDWVVVGESPESMIANGFTAIGQFFPVFLHPDTKEEYALARLERSTGPGYGDFEFNTAQEVSLEDILEMGEDKSQSPRMSPRRALAIPSSWLRQ